MESGFFFESAAGVCFPKDDNLLFCLGLLNTEIVENYGSIVNPTLTLQSGDVATIPVIVGNKELVDSIVEKNIELSKSDWDSYETSWDFKKSPLI